MNHFFIISAVLLLGFMSQANDLPCQNIDLRYQNWPALHYHQPGRGWCYAVTTSDLISQETNSRISAVALANLTERSNDSTTNRLKAYFYNENNLLYRFSVFGQSYEKVFSAAKKNSLCAWSILDDLRDKTEIRDLFLDQVFYELESLRVHNSAQFRFRIHELFDSLRANFAERLFSLAQDQSIPLIDLAVDLSCDQKIDISKLNLLSQNLEANTERSAINQISHLLSQKKVVGIGYNSQLISQPRFANREKANHASTITGQFFDKTDNICKYTIRSTDEFTCQMADPSLICRQGEFVISRDLAIQAMSNFMWLERATNNE